MEGARDGMGRKREKVRRGGMGGRRRRRREGVRDGGRESVEEERRTEEQNWDVYISTFRLICPMLYDITSVLYMYTLYRYV